jgi:hypothetical protein
MTEPRTVGTVAELDALPAYSVVLPTGYRRGDDPAGDDPDAWQKWADGDEEWQSAGYREPHTSAQLLELYGGGRLIVAWTPPER